MRFDLQKGFPAVTTKKLAWKSVVGELLWFLEGSTDERRLAEITHSKYREDLENTKTIWTANADKQGIALGYTNNNVCKELGPIYGKQWRNFNGIDQIKHIISEIKHNPNSRRIILSAWNIKEVPKMVLPPCHTLVQFRVINNKLNCLLYQRSCDMGLGANFNQASYALLTHIIARECDLEVGTFVHSIGDAHIYSNHLKALNTQTSRELFELPMLYINSAFDLQKVLDKGCSLTNVNDFKLINYEHHPPIKMDMAV